MPKKELAVIRLWHEGNSFSPVRTGAEEFCRRERIAPEKAREHYRGTATEMGAVFEFLDRNADWEANRASRRRGAARGTGRGCRF